MNRNGIGETGPSTSYARPPSRTPQRMCVGCRQARPLAAMVRLVCDPTGQLIVDPEGKLPGRGAHICQQRGCAERAVKGTRLREAFRREVVGCSADQLVQSLARALHERALGCIRMARKAGRAISGYSRVVHALAHEPVALLLVAEDTALDRLQEYKSRCAGRQVSYRSFLTKAQLGEIMGRDESSAIGIQDTRLADRLVFYLEGMSRLMER